MSESTPVAEALRRAVAGLPGGGQARAGQLEMAQAVARAFAGGDHLAVRAGTGTGKSLAYLVAAVLSGKKVLVATATKALQDQLAQKDLPGLDRRLGVQTSWAVLKGRSNYLCRQRLREAAAGAQGRLDEDPGAGPHAEQARRIAAWAEETLTGDRAELAFEPDARLWSSFSVTADECPGASRCPSGGDCFAEQARAEAAEADLVVVNLHLLGAHLASTGAVLPPFDAAVIDEAHDLEDVLSSSLGVSVGPRQLRALAASARAAFAAASRLDSVAEQAVDALFQIADRLESLLAGRGGERLRDGQLGELGEAVSLAAVRLERCEQLASRAGERSSGAQSGEDAAQRLARSVLALSRCRSELTRLGSIGEAEVAWVDGTPRCSIEIAPIDVAPVLGERLFDKVSVVLTSATLPPRLAERLGADPQRTEVLDVGSPFAYEELGLLYCAAHLPDRRRPEAEEAIHAELAELIEAAGGRTLALFTSWRAMSRAVEALRARVECPIHVQGEGGKSALVAAFSDEPAACLFATMGFWQGVDVPGPTLSLVVIDRIPFPRPDEPLTSARRELAGPAAFRLVDLPRAATLLAQGAGRLVRGEGDRGVVAVLDSRLATASYRWDLVRALPPLARTKDRERTLAYLRRLHAEALAAESI